jgi:putative endonuclease
MRRAIPVLTSARARRLAAVRDGGGSIRRCPSSTSCGAATDLGRRLREHEAGRASRYTRSRRPVELVWSRELATWSEALREEARLKRLRRAEKLGLVAVDET